MRWVWDSAEGKQSPEFTSEKQAQRILDLLMRHANDIAVTLTEVPQYYEPLFLERDHKGRTVSIVDEWCCGYVKGIALDPSGWQPLVETHPDWFQVLPLYGTESGWDRLKKLVEAHEDADARHQALVDLIAPAARNIHAYCMAAAPLRQTPSAIRDDRFTRCPFPAPTTDAPVAPVRSSNTAMEHQNCCTDLRHSELLAACCPYSSVHGKLVVQHPSRTKKVGKLPPLRSFSFLTLRVVVGEDMVEHHARHGATMRPGHVVGARLMWLSPLSHRDVAAAILD